MTRPNRLLVFLSLLSAPVSAQISPELAALGAAQAALRRTLVLSRVRQAALIQAPKPVVVPIGKSASLNCRAQSPDPGHDVVGLLDLDAMTLTSERAGSSPLLDSSKGLDSILDPRCGTLPASWADGADFEVTPPLVWGQEILQLPKAVLLSPAAGSFAANLHVCAFDGDWSTFDDVPLNCTLTALGNK